MATMESSAANTYFLLEMMTVFMKASPMLSDVASGSSATARCTTRRSYGLSGPISCGMPLDFANVAPGSYVSIAHSTR